MNKWTKLNFDLVWRLKKKWEVHFKFHPVIMLIYAAVIIISILIGQAIYPSNKMHGFAAIYILILMSFSFVIGLLELARRREEFKTGLEIAMGVGQIILSLIVVIVFIALFSKGLAFIFQTSSGNVVFVIAVLKVLVPEIKLVNLEKEQKLRILEKLKEQ